MRWLMIFIMMLSGFSCVTTGNLSETQAKNVILDFFEAVENGDTTFILASLFDHSNIKKEFVEVLEGDDLDELQSTFIRFGKIKSIEGSNNDELQTSIVDFTFETHGLTEDERERNRPFNKIITEEYRFQLIYNENKNRWQIYKHGYEMGRKHGVQLDKNLKSLEIGD